MTCARVKRKSSLGKRGGPRQKEKEKVDVCEPRGLPSIALASSVKRERAGGKGFFVQGGGKKERREGKGGGAF